MARRHRRRRCLWYYHIIGDGIRHWHWLSLESATIAIIEWISSSFARILSERVKLSSSPHRPPPEPRVTNSRIMNSSNNLSSAAASLAEFEAERDRLRTECSTLFDHKRDIEMQISTLSDQKQAIEMQMAENQTRLQWLDDKIDGTCVGGDGLLLAGRQHCQTTAASSAVATKVKFEVVDERSNDKKKTNYSLSMTQPEEYLTDPHTQLDENDFLADPSLEHHLGDDYENRHENFDTSEEARRVSTSPPLLYSNSLPGLKPSAGTTLVQPANPYARGGGAAAVAAAATAGSAGGNSIANQGTNTNTNPFVDLWNPDETTNHRNTQINQQPNRGTYAANNTLEKYFDPTQSHSNTATSQSMDTTNTAFNQRQSTNGLRRELHSNDNHHHPWSERMAHHLRRTFRIEQFRDHQEEIINVTMQGHDAFVVMRTGGGKSLTYQLPAVIESESRSRKVTVVISPLISLIRDQEEQMNQLIPGSAVSFTSNMAGGTSEHARRWGLVRDATAGVALIFVTPEKVGMSSKFKGEMEKLHNQGRLGRFVVDECHCAW